VAGPAASGGGGMSTGQGWPTPRSMEPAAVGPAANGGGGMSTCRRARGCRHSEGVFFGKYFQRWSLLAFHWCRWSLLSKIPRSQAIDEHVRY
jgi:hypothetical protein